MNGHRKSDRLILPEKPPNKTEQSVAEVVEERSLAEGNSGRHNRSRTQGRNNLRSALTRVRQAAKRNKRLQFTALWHHVYSVEQLRKAYFALKRKAAPGVDMVVWKSYGQGLEENLQDLAGRLKRGAYQAKPVRRVYIPKSGGQQRALGVTAFEDKLVQRATVEVLNAVYETDFLGFSYGCRPGRSPHMALDALTVGIRSRKVNWVLDADIRGFFDAIDHEWLIKMIGHRITDKRVIRHIKKWLKAGVLEDGKRSLMDEGVPQGACISPLLANVYLHYVFDLWTHRWRKRYARGNVTVVRYLDDFVVGFQYKSDADQYMRELCARLANFSLVLHPGKTRLIRFGRFAIENRRSQSLRKPKTFDFLGFTHICDKTSRGWFIVLRQTMRKRLRAKLKELKFELRRRMHLSVPQVGRWLRSVLLGHFRYYGVPRNIRALISFRYQVVRLWHRTLRRRSQKNRLTWERMKRLIERWLPRPRVMQPYPEQRFGVIT